MMGRKRERMIVGYHPATGRPVDAAGNLILVYEYRMAESPSTKPEAERKASTRGVQGLLI